MLTKQHQFLNMKSGEKGVSKRLNLTLKQGVLNTLKQIADERGTSIADVIRMCINIGILVYRAQHDDKKTFIYKDEKGEREFRF